MSKFTRLSEPKKFDSDYEVTFYTLHGPEASVTAKRYQYKGETPCFTGVWIHSPVPFPTGILGPDECDVLPGGVCYGDGSYLEGDVLEKELAKSEEDFWVEMERFYVSLVEERDDD